MTLTAKSAPPQLEHRACAAVELFVHLEAASFGFAEGIQSMNLWQRIGSITALTAVIGHAGSPAAKAGALCRDLRPLAKAALPKKLAR